MSLNNNIPHSTTDASEEDFKLPPLIPLQPSSATTFSPAAVTKVLQAIKGTLFTGASATCNMAPLPSAPTRIYCLACLLHDQGLNGYTVSSYQQNHGPKCKKIIPFYGFYCKHLLDNNLTATPFGDIPPEYQHFMELPRDDEIATDSSVGSLVGGNGLIPAQLSDDFYSKLSLNVNKLIKESIQEELSSLSSVVKPLAVSLEVNCDDENDTIMDELQAIDTIEPIPLRIGTRSTSTAPPLSGKF